MKNNKRNNEIRVSKPKHKTKPSQTQQRNTQNVSSTIGRQGGTNRRTNGRKYTCNPAPLPATLAAPFSLSSETEKTFEIAYCRLLSEAAVSLAARQLGNLEFVAVAGAVEVDVAGSSTAREPDNGPTALALCVWGSGRLLDLSNCAQR